MTPSHPTQAIVDLERLRQNVAIIRERLAGRSQILAVVKANAYGHGAVPVARCLAACGVSHLGVAFVEEGIELRRTGIDLPIVVLAGFMPNQVAELLQHRLIPVLSNPQQVEWLEAVKPHPPIPVHLKIDTGMGRLGAGPEEIGPLLARVARARGLVVDGLMSHFSEEELADAAMAQEQLRRFQAALDAAQRSGIKPRVAHMANSTAILTFEPAWFNLVRPGIILYGYLPSGVRWNGPPFRPVLRLRTEITHIKRVAAGTPISYGRTFVTRRPSTIAVLPIGYADGLSRALSNRGQVLIRGRRAPIVGRVCMDMTLVDATEIPGTAIGDESIVIGEQGDDAILGDEIARLLGTISYEVLCGIGPRVARVYHGERSHE